MFFLTGVWHYSSLRAGLALTPGPLMAALAAPLGGRLSDRYGQRVVAVPGAFAVRRRRAPLRAPDRLHPRLRHRVPAGEHAFRVGAGLTFAGFSSAAVAELPPNRYSTGSAINNCIRQIGAVLGVSSLIVVLGTPSPADALHVFHRAWALVALTGAIAA